MELRDFVFVAAVALLLLIVSLQFATKRIARRHRAEDQEFSRHFLSLPCPICRIPFGSETFWVQFVRPNDARRFNFGNIQLVTSDTCRSQPSPVISIECQRCSRKYLFDADRNCLHLEGMGVD